MKQNFTLQRFCKRCGESFIIHNPRSYYCPKCHQGTCAMCGKSFNVTANFKQETCSRSCSSKLHAINKRPRKVLICQWCRNSFQPSNRHLKTKFCSQQCRYESKRKPDPETHTGWRYIKWRKEVLKRDNHTCQQCGIKEKIGAHHIKAWKDYPKLRYEVANGISLCDFCHSNTHGASIPRKQVYFEPICQQCGTQTKGRAIICKSCAMKNSQKANAWRNRRGRDKKGRFA